VTAESVAESPAIPDGIEPVYTIAEAATILRWHYQTVRRYFKDLPGVLVKFQPKRYKRAKKHYFIPKSVLQREWQRMASVNSTTGRGGQR